MTASVAEAPDNCFSVDADGRRLRLPNFASPLGSLASTRLPRFRRNWFIWQQGSWQQPASPTTPCIRAPIIEDATQGAPTTGNVNLRGR